MQIFARIQLVWDNMKGSEARVVLPEVFWHQDCLIHSPAFNDVKMAWAAGGAPGHLHVRVGAGRHEVKVRRVRGAEVRAADVVRDVALLVEDLASTMPGRETWRAPNNREDG